ncbi:unnamed protein product [Miscanthus lutarioriparius]|uniref:NAC domain-containing protein n=1 Tax=Miscanthus lutarioriparius TaxID=422564 RepID=A0A811SAV2_9POAL|nr:unnamed protein product [Miscanthus lutarioriparius]
MAAAACAAGGLPPGILFSPEDEVAVGHYLLPRLQGWPLSIDGLILDDDPLSAPPWELLERNGRKEQAFFFAEGQARCGKGTRQRRTCAGGGWWEGQKTCAEGDKLRVPGGADGKEAAWRKKAFNFHSGSGGDGKRSTGWVMHEYAVTGPEDLARSPLRLYHIRLSSYGRKQCGAMGSPPGLGFLPGFVFAPEDSDAVVHYLLPRMLGQPLPLDGLILDDDPLSAPPWELLERSGRREDAFFFALGQAKSSKGSRQKRTCAGGGFWNRGEDVAWRKKALSFQEGGGEKGGSTGWVMHEYAITAPDHLAESRLRLYRIRFSGHGKKRKRGDGGGAGAGDSCGDEPARNEAPRRRVAEDDALLHMSSPQQPISSSTVLIDRNQNCINGADHHAAPVTLLAPGIVDTNSDSLGSIDINELFRLVENSSSPNPCVLPAATTGYEAHLEADGAGSSFFCQTMATAPPCSAVDTTDLVAPMNMMMMHRGCMEPIDSAIFSTAPPNQYYAAC